MEDNFDIRDTDLQQIREWTETLKLNREINVEEHWSQLESKMHGLRFRNSLFYFLRNVAAILLLPVILLSLYFAKYNHEEKQEIARIEINSAYGQVSKVILPDSSVVWLNSGSKLIYPERFTTENRKVCLLGEAFFIVTADKKRRFDVQLNDSLTVSAFGTQFDISAYEGDNDVEILLASGNVEVFTPDEKQNCTLKPSQQAVYSKANGSLTISETNIYVKTSWKDGKLVFRRASMQEVTNRLSRRFNVDIELQGKELQDYAYSATFTTESIEDILRLLEQSAPVKWRIIESKQSYNYEYTKRKVIIQTK